MHPFKSSRAGGDALRPILIIEDDLGVAELVQEKLSAYALPVVHMPNGQTARAWLQKNRPHLILLDYQLPDISGSEFVEELKRSIGGAPPFIVTTGVGDERIAVSMMKQGAKDYVVKDTHFLDNLPYIVEHTLRELEISQRLAQAEQALNLTQFTADHATEPIFWVDRQLRVRYANPAASEQLGYPPDELLSLTLQDFDCFFTHHTAEDFFAHLTQQKILKQETIYRRQNGAQAHMIVTANHMVFDDHEYCCIFAYDITVRKQAEEKLRASEERFRTLVDSLDDIVFTLDSAERHTGVYGHWVEKAGLTPELFLGKTSREILGEAAAIHESANRRALAGENVVYEWATANDRERRHYQTAVSPLRNAQKEIIGVVGVGRDITALRETELELKTLLSEKETLLRELYHRTQNNLQLVIALLDMRLAAQGNSQLLTIVHQIQSRLHAMALVHQKLYQSQNLSRINLGEYTQELTEMLLHAYGQRGQQLHLNIKVANIPALIDTAIPYGLILNELLLNCLQHAFPSPSQGEITVMLSSTPTQEIILEVSDNGVGLPDNFNLEESETLGLATVLMLSKQLRAEILLDGTHGVRCQIKFKDNLHQPRV